MAPVLVAADGGANRALDAGLRPNAVIGDLDSISDRARAAFAEVLHHIAEQETTDFEKALSRIAAPAVIALGFTGARLDHTLAVFNVLARRMDRRVILLGPEDVAFLLPAEGRLDLPAGTRLSLMPLGPSRVETRGLRWDADGRRFDPAGHTSPSNEVVSGPVSFRAEGPVLAILPNVHLADAIAAVRGG